MQVIVMGLFKLVTNTSLLCCKTGAKLIHERRHETISFVFLPQAWSLKTSSTFKCFAILPIVCLQYGRPYPFLCKLCLNALEWLGSCFQQWWLQLIHKLVQIGEKLLNGRPRLARFRKYCKKNMVSIICLPRTGLRPNTQATLLGSRRNKC